MQLLKYLIIPLVSYLLGSIPFGVLIVRFSSGKDIRQVESGRTGGTNAMRAAGFWAGLSTAILDLLKATAAVYLARWLAPGNIWLEVLCPVAAVLGHNYSLFLLERNSQGKLHFRGGAGGAPTVGGALGLWAPSVLIIVPLAALVLFGVGYASVTTMSAALIAILIFAYRAYIGASPWEFILYGIVTEAILVIALLPNIRRLINGTERIVGWRARRLKNKTSSQPTN
ncbi:MAG: glycerol-3-phosphate acyltransferase [Anaerolineales bacterium]|jgi:glycerol-3-phosphate acyltransferase PlsY